MLKFSSFQKWPANQPMKGAASADKTEDLSHIEMTAMPIDSSDAVRSAVSVGYSSADTTEGVSAVADGCSSADEIDGATAVAVGCSTADETDGTPAVTVDSPTAKTANEASTNEVVSSELANVPLDELFKYIDEVKFSRSNERRNSKIWDNSYSMMWLTEDFYQCLRGILNISNKNYSIVTALLLITI